MTQTWLWVLFAVVVVAALVLDLGVFNRRAHAPSMREALWWSAGWISLALLFNLGILIWQGREPALLFLTGYLIEESLSVDNLFVFIILFSYFGVPAKYQHKVLFWGILGAVVMRGLFISAGLALIANFRWAIFLLGAFLLYTAWRLLREQSQEVHPEHNPVLKLLRRLLPITSDYADGQFFRRVDGRLWGTPLLVVLVVVESTDVVFAVDSIPAILAITPDPFLVFTSNIFAVLGLRALFFALSGFMRKFHYLHYGLAAILAFIGLRMLFSEWFHLPPVVTLGMVGSILALSVLASLVFPPPPPDGKRP
jgi:tellurite resistance protein TerC